MPPSPDHPTSLPASGTSHRHSHLTKRLLIVVLGLIALGYLWFVRTHTGYGAIGSDSSGYLNVARLLRSGGLVQHVPVIAGLEPPVWDYYSQQPLGFTVDHASGRMVTTYSVGLPLHLLAAAPFVGLDYAMIVVNVFLAAASGVLMYALGRQCGLPRDWALAGTAVLWACPLFILHVLTPMSDVCATVWALAALCAALQSRRHWSWAFGAGLAVAVGVLVRPSSLLLLLPVGFALGWNFRAWLALVAGGLPGAVFLAWYNLKLYGAIATTGYGDVASLFALRFVPHNLAHFGLWLTLLLSPLVAWHMLGLPVLRREARGLVTLLLLWIASVMVFYVFYYHSGETWWYLRFILPVFPAIIGASLLVWRHLFSHRPSLASRPWLPAALLAVVLVWEWGAGRQLHVAGIKHGETPYLQTVEWMRAHTASDAIVLQMQLSGTFTYYTNLTVVRWDLVDRDAWTRLQTAARAQHRPIYATLFEFEEAEAIARCPSPLWRFVQRLGRISIWRLDEPGAASGA